MKGILAVMGFTFREQARRKSFIVSTVIIFLISVIIICIPQIVNSVKSTGNGKNQSSGTIYIIDSKNILGGNLQNLETALPGYKFVEKQAVEEKSLEDSIKNNGDYSLFVLDLKDGSPSFQYFVKNSSNGPDPDNLKDAIKKAYSQKLLLQNNVPQSVIASAEADISYSVNELGKATAGGMIAGYAVIFILFFAIYMYGYWVAMSIASEKTSRVMEVLITSTKPSVIVLGKSIGMGLLGLAQLVALIAIDGAAYFALYPGKLEVDGMPISFSSFSPLIVLLLIIYFIFGFSLYAMIDAVAGATVSKAEDIQQAMMPVSIICVAAFYFSYSTILAPDSTAAMAASIIPFTAPFSMPSRILNSAVPAWQIIISLILLALTAALMGYISVKLYSSAVLHYGKRLKISELISMTKSN